MIFNYFLIALYSSGAINQVYAAFVFSIIILVGKPLFSRNKIIVNGLSSPAFWILFLFCLSYVVIGELTVQGFLYYLLNPCLVFITGWALMDQCGHNLGAVITVIKFMALGYGIHASLNYVTNFGRPRWLLTDFFSGEIRAATGSGAINTLIFSLLICIICLEKRIVVKLVGLFFFAVSFLYAFQLGSRTQFVIMITVNFITLFLLLHERSGKGAVLKFAAVLVVIGALLYFMYSLNIFGIQDAYEASNLAARFNDDLSASDDYRFSSVGRGLVTMLDYPLGGLKEEGYYHNLWLDIGRISGIVPFLVMVAYSFLTFFHVIKLFRDKSLDKKVRYVLLSIYLGTLMNFFVEPILEGLINSFYSFTFLNGLTESLYRWEYGGAKRLAYRSN